MKSNPNQPSTKLKCLWIIICFNLQSALSLYSPSLAGPPRQDGPTGSYQSHGSYRGEIVWRNRNVVAQTVFKILICVTDYPAGSSCRGRDWAEVLSGRSLRTHTSSLVRNWKYTNCIPVSVVTSEHRFWSIIEYCTIIPQRFIFKIEAVQFKINK